MPVLWFAMQPIKNYLLAIVAFLFVPACLAQTPNAGMSSAIGVQKSCQMRTAPLSLGDIAFSHDDYNKAIELYRIEGNAPGPEGERARAAMIRSFLRANKIKDAEDEAKAWVAAAPDDPWSGIAMGEVQMRQGYLTDGAKSLQEAERRDPCIPQVHVDIAHFYRLNSMDAAAKQHLDMAHSLDPGDDDIESRWIQMQPRKAQLAELTKYLDQSRRSFPITERKSLERWKARLTQSPAAPCRLANTVQSTTIPYRALQNGPNAPISWGLNVSFDGNERRLQIDTGAEGLTLTKAAAAALHLVPEANYKVGGIGDEGAVDTYVAKVQSIKIGSLEFQNCDVQVLNSDTVQEVGGDGLMHSVQRLGGKDGLIGGDVFKSFLLTLDFPGHVLKLDPLPVIPGVATTQNGPSLDTGAAATTEDVPPQNRYVDSSMKDWTKVYGVGRDLIVPVHLNNGPVRLFLVDTGAGMDLISPDAAREVAHVSSASVDIYGISGRVNKTYTMGALDISFAGLRQHTQDMTAIDTGFISQATGLDISGFLGAPTLHQLTLRIDYRDKLVGFSYDPKRIVHCVETETGNLGECF